MYSQGTSATFRYEKKVGEHEWRLAMVDDAVPDEDGVVRTIVVAFRPRHKKDLGKPYVAKDAVRMTIGVQRFAVLMTVEEMCSSQGISGEPEDSASEMTEN